MARTSSKVANTIAVQGPSTTPTFASRRRWLSQGLKPLPTTGYGYAM